MREENEGPEKGNDSSKVPQHVGGKWVDKGSAAAGAGGSGV